MCELLVCCLNKLENSGCNDKDAHLMLLQFFNVAKGGDVRTDMTHDVSNGRSSTPSILNFQVFYCLQNK